MGLLFDQTFSCLGHFVHLFILHAWLVVVEPPTTRTYFITKIQTYLLFRPVEPPFVRCFVRCSLRSLLRCSFLRVSLVPVGFGVGRCSFAHSVACSFVRSVGRFCFVPPTSPPSALSTGGGWWVSVGGLKFRVSVRAPLTQSTTTDNHHHCDCCRCRRPSSTWNSMVGCLMLANGLVRCCRSRWLNRLYWLSNVVAEGGHRPRAVHLARISNPSSDNIN